MTTNAEKIAAWRADNPNEILTAGRLCDLIGVSDLEDVDLSGADLRYVDLRYVNLIGADLSGTDLRYANLRGAYLIGADLRGADLRGADLVDADLEDANLGGANLRSADLHGADLPGILLIEGLPSGRVTLVPTLNGWSLTVGCWRGTPNDLRALIASDEDWPEARGKEVARRRPLLAAALALIDVHTADWAQEITDLALKWGTDPKEV